MDPAYLMYLPLALLFPNAYGQADEMPCRANGIRRLGTGPRTGLGLRFDGQPWTRPQTQWQPREEQPSITQRQGETLGGISSIEYYAQGHFAWGAGFHLLCVLASFSPPNRTVEMGADISSSTGESLDLDDDYSRGFHVACLLVSHGSLFRTPLLR